LKRKESKTVTERPAKRQVTLSQGAAQSFASEPSQADWDAVIEGMAQGPGSATRRLQHVMSRLQGCFPLGSDIAPRLPPADFMQLQQLLLEYGSDTAPPVPDGNRQLLKLCFWVLLPAAIRLNRQLANLVFLLMHTLVIDAQILPACEKRWDSFTRQREDSDEDPDDGGRPSAAPSGPPPQPSRPAPEPAGSKSPPPSPSPGGPRADDGAPSAVLALAAAPVLAEGGSAGDLHSTGPVTFERLVSGGSSPVRPGSAFSPTRLPPPPPPWPAHLPPPPHMWEPPCPPAEDPPLPDTFDRWKPRPKNRDLAPPSAPVPPRVLTLDVDSSSRHATFHLKAAARQREAEQAKRIAGAKAELSKLDRRVLALSDELKSQVHLRLSPARGPRCQDEASHRGGS
jgi:hypothetical protein